MVTFLEEDKQDFLVRVNELHSLEEAGIPDAEIVRRPLDREHLESLILSDPRRWSPILITKTTIGYVLLDGYHLRAAARSKGLDEIKATSKTFRSEIDVIRAAFAANLHNGLGASREERSSYAYWLHISRPNLSQAEIAEKAGITQATVSIAIEKREELIARAKRNGASDEYARKHVAEMLEEEEKQESLRKSVQNLVQHAKNFLETLELLGEEEREDLLRELRESTEDSESLLELAHLMAEILE